MDDLNEDAREFSLRYGFVLLEDAPMHLYHLPLKVVEKLLAE